MDNGGNGDEASEAPGLFGKIKRFWRNLIIVLGLVLALPAAFAAVWISNLDINPNYQHQESNPYLWVNPSASAKCIHCIEDRRFYEHSEVDIRSLARAFVHDLQSREFAEAAMRNITSVKKRAEAREEG